jgi:hypothetical protein
MRKCFWIMMLICIIIVGCTPSTEPDSEIMDEPSRILDSKNDAVKPFELEKRKVTGYRVISNKTYEAVTDSMDLNYGREFIEALNNSLKDMRFDLGPDITVYLEDGKRVELRLGCYVRFVDGDEASDYLLLEPPKELIDAYNKIFEEVDAMVIH